MEIIELNKDEEKGILDYIKEIILNRHPIVEDRLDVLLPLIGEQDTPEMKIHFRFGNIEGRDITRISFMDGFRACKTVIPEEIQINGLIDIETIYDFLRFLLTDHGIISCVSRYDENSRFDMDFDVNCQDDNMQGISCGKITVEFNFMRYPNSFKLYSYYFRGIVSTFFDKLKNTGMIKREFADYCNSIKQEFSNSLSEVELRDFIGLFSISDLYNAINSLSDNRFIELYNQYNDKEMKRKLTDK